MYPISRDAATNAALLALALLAASAAAHAQDRVQLHLRSDGDPVTFFAMTARGIDRLCATPCEGSLPAGTYAMRLGDASGGRAIAADLPVPVAPATPLLVGRRRSVESRRIAGGVGGALFGVGGIALIAVAPGLGDSSALINLNPFAAILGGVLCLVVAAIFVAFATGETDHAVVDPLPPDWVTPRTS